ncbi:MAG TPA: hypothetical protein VFA07_19140 [Chthonomonadaceae bacterium]|nr:hypothetical protein [Chthonomonadaceae bacterium]
MPAQSANTSPREISPAVVIGVIAVVIIVVIFIAWRLFSPPPDPMAGMTLQQKAEAIRKAGQNFHPPYQLPVKSGGLRHRNP